MDMYEAKQQKKQMNHVIPIPKRMLKSYRYMDDKRNTKIRLLQRTIKMQSLDHIPVIQKCGNIGNIQRPINDSDTDEKRRISRVASSYISNGIKPGTKRNLLIATTVDSESGKKINYGFMSAGLGGQHPKFNGRSAAHTEEQFQALCSVIEKPVKIMYSSHQACDKSPGNPHGCKSIPLPEMGMTQDSQFLFSTPYVTGGKKQKHMTFGKLSKLSKDTSKHDSSEDELFTSESFRGCNMEELTKEDLYKMSIH